ncbi:MAG TPA: hypothetical protein ENI92_09875 [Bacteroidetes bacterium]|nr:hypothetical protein [Bacteroidota bacterium]
MYDPDHTFSWIVYGDGSYIATRLLWFTSRQLEASVLSQRTVELYLKAYLVSNGVSIVRGSEGWGHQLTKLKEECSVYSTDFSLEAFSRRVGFFDRYFELVRYPSKLDALKDGQMIWFSFDATIEPLDEIVAFVRPRVKLTQDEWKATVISSVLNGPLKLYGYQQKALRDHNDHIDVIACSESVESKVLFNKHFSYDLPGC